MSSGVTHRPLGPADDVAELPAGLTDGRRVDDRRELFEMVGQEPVEERLVAVLQRGEPDVALEVVRLAAKVFQLEATCWSSVVTP